ncbi:MAG: glycerol-3-phosphate dehydrogenase/oxidase [Pseudomonadota bacterium]
MTLGTRANALERLAREPHWDLIVVGGGITGAGVLREAARLGLRVLLLEQRDYAWGTSSRSSKMVHGGLRYIAQGDFRLTRDALQERERLLREAPGLVERMGYTFPVRRGQFPGRWTFSILLALYDRFAGIDDHRWLSAAEAAALLPGLKTGRLKGACRYTDAVTDDARLVLRVLQDGVADGGVVLNHAKVVSLVRDTADPQRPRVTGVVVQDMLSGRVFTAGADAVVSATGAWADRLRSALVAEKRVRPLRGSHLVVPHARLPVREAMTLLHPRDRRPVFVFPWEGTTVIGTTDLDHPQDLDIEAAITREEVEYLYDAIASQFDGPRLTDADVVSTWSGVRPVIAGDQAKDPSKERRDHAVWADGGLVTVSGGKLTTFRLIAHDALRAAAPFLGRALPAFADRALAPTPASPAADPARARHEQGRYGAALPAWRELLVAANAGADAALAGTAYSPADILWSLRHEQVAHLDDLLLRRTRLGNLLPGGARDLLPSLRAVVQQELGWDDARWNDEVARYLDIWQRHYSLPPAATH